MSGDLGGAGGGARGPCAVCGVASSQSCSRCLSARYCSAAHQTQHWQQHRQHCSPGYKLLDGHLVAARNIRRGAIIFREKPIVVHPSWQNGEFSCGNCCKLLDSDPDADWATCECGLPLCRPRCARDSRSLHTAAECALMCEYEVEDNLAADFSDGYGALILSALGPEGTLLLSALGPLRCLLLSGRKLQALQAVESHEDKVGLFWSDVRARTPGCPLTPEQALEGEQEFDGVLDGAVDLIRRMFGSRWSPAEVRGVVARLHSMASCYVDHHRGIKGCPLYEKASLLPCSCRPNTRLASFGKEPGDFSGAILATEDIPAGAVLTLRYVSSALQPTAARRLDMARRLKLCRCQRCQDPTEMGTHLGSPSCKICVDRKLPASPLVPTGPGAQPTWRCGVCRNLWPHDTVMKVMQLLAEDMERVALSGRPADLEELLRKSAYPKAPLHPTSTIILTTKWKLMEAYGAQTVSALASKELCRLAEVCRELLPVLDILAPGLSEERGKVLLHLVLALTEKGRRKARQASTHQEARAVLAVVGEAEKHLLEMKRIHIEPVFERILAKLSEDVADLKARLGMPR